MNELFIIKVNVYDSDNTQSYIYNDKIFVDEESALDYLNEKWEEIQKDHWTKYKEDHSPENIEEDNNAWGNEIRDMNSGQSLTATICRLNAPTQATIHCLSLFMKRDIYNYLQEQVTGYDSARLAVYDMRNWKGYYFFDPEMRKPLLIQAVCNVGPYEFYILLKDESTDNPDEQYLWMSSSDTNIGLLHTIWEKTVKLHNKMLMRAYNPLWLGQKDNIKTILNILDEPYEKYKERISTVPTEQKKETNLSTYQ